MPQFWKCTRLLTQLKPFGVGRHRLSVIFRVTDGHWYTGWPKKLASLCFVCLNFAKYWPIFTRFSLSESGSENICNNAITEDPTTPQVCRYTTLWNVTVLKATIENEMTSVTTHFKSASSSSKAHSLNIDVKAAGCDCYFWGNKHVVFCS